jgi:hypothetical protein
MEQPRTGDLWVAQGTAERRVLYVAAVYHEDHSVTAFLVTSEYEYATQADVVFEVDSPMVHGPRWPVVVQTDLMGTVGMEELQHPRLGRLTGEGIERVREVGLDHMGSGILHMLLRLHSQTDPRWGFKEQELVELHALQQPYVVRMGY